MTPLSWERLALRWRSRIAAKSWHGNLWNIRVNFPRREKEAEWEKKGEGSAVRCLRRCRRAGQPSLLQLAPRQTVNGCARYYRHKHDFPRSSRSRDTPVGPSRRDPARRPGIRRRSDRQEWLQPRKILRSAIKPPLDIQKKLEVHVVRWLFFPSVAPSKSVRKF